jgi:agmatine deiminase
MITDDQTNFLYLSKKLKDKREFFERLKACLVENKVEFQLLPKTKDIWAVDYMPVQLDDRKFIQFVYAPDYLQNDKFISTQTATSCVCNAIGLKTIRSNIKIDGGNVIQGKNWVILTEKIFKENPSLKRKELISELEYLFEAKPIIIPEEPNDFTGHADGIVRYYNDETVLFNNYKPKDKKAFQKNLIKVLNDEGLKTIKIPYNPYQNRNQDMAHGLYINYLRMKNFILLPIFNMKEDEEAYRLFEKLFNGQNIETIDARDVSKEGGVLNCISWNILVNDHSGMRAAQGERSGLHEESPRAGGRV